jgi:UDP-N-acetylmuramate--alanine ligase
MLQLHTSHSIYFLGIGGIGMSALARYFVGEGKVVSGYDRSRSVVTDALEAAGIPVFFEADAQRVHDADVVVYTPAIPAQHPERVAALRLGKPMYKRAEVLGAISRQYRTLAVAGTHGKTTTSTMLAHLLRHAGLDITAFLGGLSVNLGGNFIHGSSPWLVVEADEYDRSFLQLQPEWAVINSLDPDHLDIYGSAEAMTETYHRFAEQTQHLLVHIDLAHAGWTRPVQTFGDHGDFQVKDLKQEGLTSVFDLVHPQGQLTDLRLSLPGRHNAHNMAAACALGLILGLSDAQLTAGVASFRGIYRRFEVQVDRPDLTYIDDYAHHPREIAAALGTARACFPDRQLVVVFQPHLYSRTRDFYEGFAQELSQADAALLMPIYPAREEPLEGVSSQGILDRMTLTHKALTTREALVEQVKAQLRGPTVLLTLGAGDIDQEVPRLTRALTLDPRPISSTPDPN